VRGRGGRAGFLAHVVSLYGPSQDLLLVQILGRWEEEAAAIRLGGKMGRTFSFVDP
jgi:hypothetical protein